MAITGRCYCGELRYEADGAPQFKGQCHCRECQYISGGAENLFMVMPTQGFRYVKGEPKRFSRKDLPAAVTREFCATCGTHVATRLPSDASILILKVGTLDDPGVFGGAQAAIWTADAQPFHVIPDGMRTFPGLPGH